MRKSSPRYCRRRGFTLIEVLVALTVTLILTALVAELMQRTTESVQNSRAMIDLNDQLRNAKHRLILDLKGITAPTTPPLSPHKHLGYFEYVEGPMVANSSGGDIGTAVSGGGRNTVNGDLDDILMFTTASFEEQFVARGGVRKGIAVGAKSRYAEVAWFLRAAPGGEYYTLHRRVWLVVPNRQLFGSDYPSVDVSMRQVNGWHDPDAVAGAPNVLPCGNGYPSATGRLPRSVGFNTLGDLTRREFRSLHQPYVWPHAAMLIKGSGNPAALGLPTLMQQSHSHFPNPLCETVDFRDKTTKSATPPPTVFNANTGNGSRAAEDVILTYVVGFDVKAWDPGAPVFASPPHQTAPNQAGIVVPGDAGYIAAVDRFVANPLDSARQPVAFGAFADLNYLANFGSSGVNYQKRFNAYSGIAKSALFRYEERILGRNTRRLPRPFFAHPGDADCALSPNAGTAPAVYDTWSTHYEHDGVDNNGRNGIDEGTNGVDDNGNGLVDEPDAAGGERDAPPPYSAPLRGLQIQLRVMDHDTKQVRQVTVHHEFVPL